MQLVGSIAIGSLVLPPPLPGFPTELRELIQNLLPEIHKLNARDFMYIGKKRYLSNTDATVDANLKPTWIRMLHDLMLIQREMMKTSRPLEELTHGRFDGSEVFTECPCGKKKVLMTSHNSPVTEQAIMQLDFQGSVVQRSVMVVVSTCDQSLGLT